MADLNTDEPVALRQDQSYVGRIKGVRNGVADVEFEGGGSGRIRTDDLVQVADKSWPPSGMETKVPDVETK